MIGRIDERRRALLDVKISCRLQGDYSNVTAWIDTAFDGHLVFPKKLIDDLELDTLVETEAILADGSKVTLDTFLCYIDWFGKRLPLQVIANDGRLPLIGTELLADRILHIDYLNETLTLE